MTEKTKELSQKIFIACDKRLLDDVVLNPMTVAVTDERKIATADRFWNEPDARSCLAL